MSKRIICLLSVIIFVASSYAEWEPASFVDIGVGARAISLGRAFSSVVEDGSSLYWNPAGLGGIKKLELSFMGRSLMSDEWTTLKNVTPRYECMYVVLPVSFFRLMGNSAVGIGWLRSSLGNIPYTYLDADGYIVRDEFESLGSAFLVSWGDKVTLARREKMYFGLSLRVISVQFSKIKDASAVGYDIVAGIIYRLGRTNLGLAVDRGINLVWVDGYVDKGPLSVQVGISHRFLVFENIDFVPMLEILQKQNYPIMSNLGLESEIMLNSFLKKLFIRCGISEFVLEDRFNYRNRMNERVNFSLGGGFKIEYEFLSLSIDYAYSVENLGNKQRISISLFF